MITTTRPTALGAMLVAALAAPGAEAQAEFTYSFDKSLSYGGATLQEDTSAEPLAAELISTDAGWSTWQANADRGELSIGASHSSTKQFQHPNSTATMRFDDIVFSSSGDAPVTVRMRLRLDVDAAEGAQSYVHVESIGGSPFSGGVSTFSSGNGTGILAGFDIADGELSFLSPPTQVPVNEPVSLGAEMRLVAYTGTSSARLSFESDGPAFDVPPGVTVDSVESMIVDNQWRPAMVAQVPGDFPTIQAALSAVGDGSEIVVAKGTYFEALELEGRSDITLTGKGKVVIDVGFASTPCLTLRDCTNVDVSKLTLVNGTHGMFVDGCEGVQIERCTVSGSTSGGITLIDTDDFTVERCKLEAIGGFALWVVSGQSGTIERNTVDSADGAGIILAGEGSVPQGVTVTRNKLMSTHAPLVVIGHDHVVEKNKIKGGSGVAIDVNGNEASVQRNKVTAFDGDGIRIDGYGSRVEKNKISKTTGHGLYAAHGPGPTEHVIKGNKITAPGLSGVVAMGMGDVYEKNKVAKAGLFGFDVGSAFDTLIANKAKGSGEADLLDDGYETAYDGNTFKTVSED